MSVNDHQLQQRVMKAIALQEQGLFIVDCRHDLPLPGHKSLENMRYSNNRDEIGRYYDYETDWGKFSFDPDSYRSLLCNPGRVGFRRESRQMDAPDS